MPINTMDLAKRIWDQSPHNWNDFRQTLLSEPERFGDLDQDQIKQLVEFSRRMEIEEEQFPRSVEKLHRLLADELATYSPSFIP